jgi:hypothetical protein
MRPWHHGALATVALVAACRGADRAAESYAPAIDSSRFAATVDNRFFPLEPGTAWIYQSDDGTERVEVTVTSEIKRILGVNCTVVSSREYDEGALVEETLDWYAQDSDGTVWYFGEQTRAYRDGRVVSTEGSWQAGMDDAQPGIIMPGSPVVGMRYRQEYYRGHAEDMGEVLALDGRERVPFGSFEGAVVTRDWTPLEPGVEERKYYAPGVGLALEHAGRTRVELVSMGRGSTRTR